MSNPNTFMASYVIAIQNLCNLIQQLRQFNDQLAQDSTISSRYFTIVSGNQNAQGQVPRNDIVAADVTNAQSAITQIIFAYDSGAPTQKSLLFKMFQ